MNTTPVGLKSRVSNDVASFKITPSNSPILKPSQKSPIRPSFSPAILSLQKVIGTTTSSQCGFACHSDSRKIALCAGSAVLLADFDEAYRISQRFYRALPTASAVNFTKSASRSTIHNTTPDSRRRSIAPTKVIAGTLPPPSPNRELSEQESFKTWTSRKRIKAASSTAISHDGRYLAVGETGYSPRVLIFSTDKNAPTDTPVSIANEHSSSIRAVAFSPDSQYLATLGDVNDGFLLVYAFNRRTGSLKLLCTNKCTAWVRDIAWFGNSLITVGTRHVKVWRLPELVPGSPSKSGRQRFDSEPPSSPGGKALSGRNVILGPYADFTFTCVVGLSQHEAILCSENGAICLVDDTYRRQELKLANDLGWCISSVAVDRDGGLVWFGGSGHRMHCESIDILTPLNISPLRSSPFSGVSTSLPNSPISRSCSSSSASIIAIGSLGGKLICLDSERNLGIRDTSKTITSTDPGSIQLLTPAHSGAIEGVRTIQKGEDSEAFFTWSRDGNVRFWDSDGSLRKSARVEIEQLPGSDEPVNELKSLCASPDENYFISGDRLGVVRVMRHSPWSEVHHVKAHSSEITNLAAVDSVEGLLLATSGRDRILQLFQKTEADLTLVQTMDEHVGSVGGLIFADGGDRLISYSSDRTIVIRQRFTKPGAAAIYSPQRVITLKASPVSLVLHPVTPEIMIVSTMDRHILRFDIDSGSQTHFFKTSDPDDNDTVIMGSLSMSGGSTHTDIPLIFAGVSSTDKSIRVYDYAKDSLLTREFGHIEGVSDVALLEPSRAGVPGTSSSTKRILVSTGLDGMVMLWELSLPSTRPLQELTQPNLSSPEVTLAKGIIAGKTPIRRVLSKSDLTDYTRFDPSSGTTTPIRDQSPPRVRRRASKYGSFALRSDALSEQSPIPTPSLPPLQAQQALATLKRDSPTPSTFCSPNATDGSSAEYSNESESFSPSTNQATMPMASDGPKQPSIAVSSKGLRRTPSTPTNLRSFSRSKSSSNLRAEFGSVNAAGDQTSRAVKAYRKKVDISRDGDLDPKILEDVERELQLTADLVSKKLKNLQRRHSTVTANSQGSDNGLSAEKNGLSLSKDNSESVPQPENPGKDAPRTVGTEEASGEG